MSTTSTARTVTDVFQPRNVLLAGLTGIGVAAARDWTGAAWGLFAALCAGIVPYAYIEWEQKRGTWGDRHVVDRRQRPRIFGVILASIGIGSGVMILAGAPSDILVAMLALWAVTVLLLAVNSLWKISVDATVASAVVAMLAAVHSPWWLLGYALVVAVCWSRVALTYHSVAQTVAGSCLGAATAVAFVLA
ncbi:hypothetical protein [Streptomyces sp. H27-D2]|uniref:hypothetical protein n=1 Tax=Streptomyces sp. H27-D2 TaxID=3046304 RepID=UPI002DB69246|nr:hypothetical protein [Streptomyces sp. H27-D2]MEC4018825.1 hypothetical protein [Streptomyces sp. H27-D2]